MPGKMMPCPHCNRRKNIAIQQMSKYEWFCRCSNCGMSGPVEVSKDNAIDAWNALPRHLKWTKEKPTKDGAYWYRKTAGERMIAFIEDEMVTILDFPGEEPLDFFDGEWAGPLPAPMEAK